MFVDSFRHGVEQEMRKKPEDFQDFVDKLNICGQSIVMNYHDLFDVSQAKYTASKPKLEDIQSVKFDKESERMFWKTSHIHKKSSAVLDFFKERSLKVSKMISSELESL